MAKVHTVVLVRHGESEYNRDNIFTGWCDPDLTAKGQEEAKDAGKILQEYGFQFDVAYTSVLKRAIKTLYLIQEELDCLWIPVTKTWRLNERHYGKLQGKNKDETIKKYGREQVQLWRRSFKVCPPPLDEKDEHWSGNDKRYSGLSFVPTGESIEEASKRSLPFWHKHIVPALKSGKRPLICGHANTLGSLIKNLDPSSKIDLSDLSLPNALPLVLELDESFLPSQCQFLQHPSGGKLHKKRNCNS
ncbi:2,3-bisphosphoglycerate-dependent phosphoglycerate mutase [Elysia marginata]|uniref:Phosphoglycerate mutase n=1 Tax=Elysia marginata TaxID=1093978 RepID=A0AAV4FV52_9GAST|nr:2,3-bisphosphoglycerate-dependent phosphoglycerate mutase [Elysia marginata]